MPFSVVQQHIDPRNLSINITSSTGKVFRWGPDETSAANIPAGLNISTAIPGGFTTCDVTLNRRPDLTYYDLDRFAPFTVTGAGGSLVAFDGYLSERPMQRGSSYSFQPEAIGWSAHMKDDASFSYVYIDRQLSTWVGPSTARQITLLGVPRNIDQYSLSATFDQGGAPALSFITQGTLNGEPTSEAWYDAGAGNLIATVSASNIVDTGYGSPDVKNILDVFSASGDDAGITSVLSLTSTNSGSPMTATGLESRFAMIQHFYNSAGPNGSAGTNYGWYLENLYVLGNHGLTLQPGPSGISPGADDGFFGSDLVIDIIHRAAPLLGVKGVVANSFVVPQLVFNTPTDADTAVQAVNQYFQNDYGVYEDQDFFWRPPGTGTQWHARLSDGATLQDQGPQIETAINGVIVQFTDAGGVSRSVGPPSYGGDATSSALQDLSSTNPANMYGRKRWTLLQMQGTSTTNAAIAAGANFLQANLDRTTAGSITVVGFAKNSNGREWPAWRIRSGDTIIIDDSSDTSAHYILGTSYDHDSLTSTLTIDAPPDSSSWLLQRLNLVIPALG